MLSREQGDEVLRYWLASLRLEEALQIRPQARRSTNASALPRLDRPTPGQDYFKLPLDSALAQLLSQEIQLKRPFDPELAGFFETWLDGQYRRGDDEGELAHLLCFPVLHLARGELAGLVRCGVRLRFGSGDSKAFRAPSRAERARANYPQVPDEVRLTRAPRADGAWPFFIDSRLLRQPLGVSTERIDALFEALRTLDTVSEQQMLGLLTTTLEACASRSGPDATAEGDDVAALATRLKTSVAAESCGLEIWLARLTNALRRLLGQSSSRAQVYPVGIVVDGTQAKTTWHLQRELGALLDAEAGESWKVSTPLGAYLTGQPRPTGEAPQRALFPGPALSLSQRAAAEHFWGGSFSAVQGPPGTGKTSLILHLCAEALVRQVEPLLDGGRMGNELFLIASSNNRAVDNVIEPLTSGDGLPLALRAGSRQVCEQQLVLGLRRTLAWLKRAELQSPEERSRALTLATERFKSRRAELERLIAPRRQAQQQRETRARLERAIEQSSKVGSEAAATHAHDLAKLSAGQRSELAATIAKVEKRLRALSRLCEATPGAPQLEALARHYKRTARDLPALERGLGDAQLTLELPLPPPIPQPPAGFEQSMEAWEEATELSLRRLGELRSSLDGAETWAKALQEQQRLRAELAALGPRAELPLPQAEDHEPLSRELFDAAVALREAWASQSAAELGKAVATALRTVEQERSLRPLFRNELQAARWLCRLFGIWGSTLLSLGNCFPSEPGSIARLVIDEAGQCHPAHAVSALMRADAALVIGDVHQLTPVIELSADDEARLFQAGRFKTPASKLLPYRIHEGAQISTQSLSDRAVNERRALVDHFRCQPEIIAISDRLCGYGLTVHTAPADRSRNAAYLARPVALVDLRGEQARLAGSWCNELELKETLVLVESLLDRGVLPAEIAVITPYRGQLECLRREFAERRIPLEYSSELVEGGAAGQLRAGVALGTVHRFQGGERSIVLFSSVVTQTGSLAFLDARPNLLNVAVSRARHHFVCLGHAAVLAQGARTRWLTESVHALTPGDYTGPWRLRP